MDVSRSPNVPLNCTVPETGAPGGRHELLRPALSALRLEADRQELGAADLARGRQLATPAHAAAAAVVVVSCGGGGI